ncbi:muraminidase (plasmid) [Azospirillum baldaniorum]|uniref:Lysozyme n=1 Tax=Azospirillum baldaniorum TaxID=1064539 RepID=A0A9P1NPJ7_9PROT|nr:lysozyme [Azospirillum baldaniorum]AWJ92495.1 muraminidase [Azospirillum baldaniorum]NUB09423.1 lysozyme [Azospirillum baldaniorum]TWA75731.1 GH24 family phage-related lysozyme (muramidase) [Azospirillum brasilense]CCD01045.1 putative lysozyme [Azospirillum baldaniorum]
MTTTSVGAAIPGEIHPDALTLVGRFEGLSLKAYLCPVGVTTIGYGHIAGAQMDQTITSLQAEVFRRADMADAARDVDRLAKVPLTDRQSGALVSFVFNLGAGALQTSTLLRLLNQGDYVGAAAEFPKWVYATVDGKKVQLGGLKKRRAAEKALFGAG